MMPGKRVSDPTPVPDSRSCPERMEHPLIIVVGVCASGKTTLAEGLRRLGFNAHSVAQEHSASRHFWQRRQPDIVIGLQCSYETTVARRGSPMHRRVWERQWELLADAYEHAQIIIRTDGMSPEELIEQAHQSLVKLQAGPHFQSRYKWQHK